MKRPARHKRERAIFAAFPPTRQQRARQRLNWWRVFGLAACIASACVVFGLAACIASACVVFGAIRYLLS